MNLTRRSFAMVSRRRFLSSTLIGTGCLAATSTVLPGMATVAKEDKYQDLKSAKYLGKVTSLIEIEDEMVFTEGPAADGAGHLAAFWQSRNFPPKIIGSF